VTFTPIPAGEEPWNDDVNDAFSSQDLRITANENSIGQQSADITQNREHLMASPLDYGQIAWNYEPWLAATAIAPSANQVLNMMRVEVRRGSTASGVFFLQQVGGTGFVAGNNYAGIYDSLGNLLTTSTDADMVTQSTQAGFSQVPVAPVNLPAGTYYVASLMDATTRPTYLRTVNVAASAPAVNVFQSASTALWTQAAGTYTGALPASVTMASRTILGTAWFAGIY
jgi:hypothetical protein